MRRYLGVGTLGLLVLGAFIVSIPFVLHGVPLAAAAPAALGIGWQGGKLAGRVDPR